jgi:putative ABC transport system permease protein
MQSPLQIDYLMVISLFTLILFSGSLLTGLLPAIYMSGFAPGLVLKGKNPAGAGWIKRLKNYLVVFQFTISVILIAGTITILRQINFMRKHDLGFDISGLIVLEGPRNLRSGPADSFLNSLESFKNDIRSLSLVKNITASSGIPGTEIKNSRVYGIPVEGRNTEKKIELYYVDDQFFNTYGLTLIAGDNFGAIIKEESNRIILNESALSYFGFDGAEKSIGKILRGGSQEVTIKGLINDFNQQSLKELPRPLGFFNQPSVIYYTIKADPAGMADLLPAIERIWNAHYHGNPFHYFFLDEFYNRQYQADRRFSGLFLAGSLLAIIIACLGLSGLSAYSIVRRTKEIGIRKSNGATIMQVLILLNVDFVKLVIVAILLAVPVAWFVMSKWLENYAYRIEISWWIFLLSGTIAVAVAIITVSWQSWAASKRNPVEALRYE